MRSTVAEHPSLAQSEHTVAVEVPSEAIVVDADRTRIVQVVNNLLGNAARFTPTHGTITVRVEPDDDQVRIVVADTGVGIPPSLLERVFEPFSQAPQSVARTSGGLGLGLALVREVVSLHGGQVRAESAGPDRGTTMTIQLARRRDAPAQPAEAAPGRLTPQRILVVEDNRDAAEMLAELLRVVGHDVDAARTPWPAPGRAG